MWQRMAFASANREKVIVTDVILPELGFLFQRDLGYMGLVQFLDRFRNINWRIESLRRSDLDRVFEISKRYADAEVDVVDCCIIALAERLHITKIATFDRRDFHIIRPGHTDYFEILPYEAILAAAACQLQSRAFLVLLPMISLVSPKLSAGIVTIPAGSPGS